MTDRVASMRSDNATISSGDELRKMLSAAREQGAADPYVGKRRWTRYALGIPLEITRNPEDTSAGWRAIMHNVSGGGIGLWSRHELKAEDIVYIRDWNESRNKPWTRTRVAHCTLGIQGFLAGLSVDTPTSPEEDITAISLDAPAPPRTKRKGSLHSLRTMCALIPTTSSAIGVITAGILCNYYSSAQMWLWMPALGVSFGVAGIAGWFFVIRELRFLDALQSAIREMMVGKPRIEALSKAPSRELAEVHRALEDLAAAWQKRDNANKLQRQRLEQTNELKSNILSIVSHDLRTPLTSILLYADMLNNDLEELAKDDQRHFLKIISDETNRLSRLVEDLLEVQRLEAGRARWNMQPRDLAVTIQDCANVFRPMAERKAQRFRVLCPNELPPVEADTDRISQVLSNLLSNAVKYTPGEGYIELGVEVRGKDLLVRVSDTGPGISRDKWDQIFNRFTQLADPNVREISGVGLGLYIVKQLVERHNGTVWVDSDLGKGTDFFVSLPLKENKEVTVERVDFESRGNVLVCDADPELAATISRTLRQIGFDCRTVHSGWRLVGQLETCPPDVLVTDLLLPDMNATHLLDALESARDAGTRIIVHSYAGCAGNLRRRGVDIFLKRPATKEELTQAVEVAIHGSHQTGLNVLTVGCSHVDAAAMSETLTTEGHVPILVDSMEKAASVLQEYPIDAVVVHETSLGTRWSKVSSLHEATTDDTPVYVLCHEVRKREQRLARNLDIEAVPYSRGMEERVAEALRAKRPEPAGK